MRTPVVAALLCLALIAPSVSRAQADSEAAAPLEDRPAVKLNEVERGLFFGAETGAMVLFGPQAKDGVAGGLSLGRTLGVTVGADIGDILSIAVLVLGAQIDTPAGFHSPLNMRGDFSSLILGGVARVALLGVPDANGIKRFYVHGRAGGGVGLMGPKNFYSGSDVVLFGGADLEYFTHLRHFSVGLNADFVFGNSNLGPGVMVSPNLKYTF